MSVSISALQRNASEVVRKVAISGKAEEITDRGKVLAVLAPPPEATGLAKLRKSGQTVIGTGGSIRDFLRKVDGLPSVDLGRALEEQRDAER